MALKLYRRHRKECEAGLPEDERTGQFEEGRRGWKRCACQIHASGTLGGRFNRKQTGKSNWEEAKAVAAAWEAARSWDEPVETPTVTEAPRDTKRSTIEDVSTAYLASRKNLGIAAATLGKDRTLMKQLRGYCESRGYVVMDQLTVADMDRFYASWPEGKRARAKKLERLKGFVKFCLKRKWLAENITEDLKAPEGSSIPANKTPFSDEEIARIYSACDKLGGPTRLGPGHREWNGEDVKDFVMFSLYTGMRISDVTTFNIQERLKGNDVFLRMHKTKKELYTWVPDWLVARLREREKKHGAMIFRYGTSNLPRTMAERWRIKLAKVFRLAGPFEEPPTSHRFRHTFVRILLEKGVPIADVAELIGDTEQILRKHYAKWVPGRQARLTKILKEAFEERPRPKLVMIPGGRT